MITSPLVAVRSIVLHAARTSLYLYHHADLTVFRMLFAAVSFSLAISLVTEPVLFQQVVFTKMREMAGAWWWALAFVLHGLLVSWRLLDIKPRVAAALAINCYGFALWALYVILLDVAIKGFAINSSAERIIVIFAFITIPATGTRREVVSP